MSRWWEWDGTQAGANRIPEPEIPGIARLGWSAVLWAIGVVLMLGGILSIFIGARSWSAWGIGLACGCIVLSYLVAPSEKKS